MHDPVWNAERNERGSSCIEGSTETPVQYFTFVSPSFPQLLHSQRRSHHLQSDAAKQHQSSSEPPVHQGTSAPRLQLQGRSSRELHVEVTNHAEVMIGGGDWRPSRSRMPTGRPNCQWDPASGLASPTLEEPQPVMHTVRPPGPLQYPFQRRTTDRVCGARLAS